MRKSVMKWNLGCLWAILGIFMLAQSGWSYEINDKFSISGIIAGAWQYQDLDYAPDFDSEGRGAMVFQPEMSFTPTDSDELFAKFGFGAGNGLMEEGQSPFTLAPWAADVADDYKNINGRNRDYLLTAWYKHDFRFSGDHTVAITGGIIDAADYMDENAFSNDEFTQFMNEALVNAPNAFLPSYDLGTAIEWEINDFSVKGAAMAMGTNGQEGELDEPYNAYFMQLGYTLYTPLGQGNYRLLMGMSSEAFPNPQGTSQERRRCTIVSLDQELGDTFGVWMRLGWQDDKAVVVHKAIFSGGLNISGNLWGRDSDHVGIGYAQMRGGNLDVDKTDVFEVYGRFALNDIFAITGDVQYMKDSMKVGDSPDGWIFGLRATAEF
ncbi:MAG: carbohydrate porin [Thermodesulfobacteriota bacterium]